MKTLSEIQFGIKNPTQSQKEIENKILDLQSQDEETIEQGNHGLHTLEIQKLKKLLETSTIKCLICMQHELTDNQIHELEYSKLGIQKIDSLKNVNADLFSVLSSMNGNEGLQCLSDRLHEVIYEGRYKFVILPIGSPAFMYCFAQSSMDIENCSYPNYEALFSHSERKSIEKINEDGTVTKSSIFEHKKFIVI